MLPCQGALKMTQSGPSGEKAMKSPPPRRWTSRQKRQLWLTAIITAALGSLAFVALEGRPQSNTPLTFALEEMGPEQTGLHFQHEMGTFAPFYDNVRPFMQAVSAAACVSDVDRDGLLDLYLLTSKQGAPNKLFKNEGAFHFSEVPIPAIADLNQGGFSSDCVFADVDNDGFDDLMVGMVGQGPRLFRNVADATTPLGRSFQDITASAGMPPYMNGFAVSFFDVENDGDLDLLLSSYFSTHYREKDVKGSPRIHPLRVPDSKGAGMMMPNDWGNADNGGVKTFLINDGQGNFETQNLAAWGLSETRFTFDIGTADINLDGYTDVYFANDFGPDQLYLNKGGKGFVDVKGATPTEVGRDSFKGMNADLADMDHDGFPEIYVTNVFHPALPEGNLLWKNAPDPQDPFLRRFKNVAAELGTKDGGWGWGAKFVDVDLDGDTDLIATNGYISANPDKDYWYRMSRLAAGSGDIITDTRNWPDFDDASFCGHQKSRVFVREGHRFFKRGEDAGINRSFDGRGVLIADFDVDGRPDVLFVAQGGPYFLARNTFKPTPAQAEPPGFVGIRLRGDGARVPKNAVGSRVVVRPANADAPYAFEPLYREVSAGNGMSAQSMTWIVAGLGNYKGPVDVEIHWSDGSIEEHKRLASGRYHDLTHPTRSAKKAATATEGLPL
jgi:hypothetical protein